MRFSKKTGCFYPPGFNYNERSDDLIEVTQEEYRAAMSRAAGETLAVVNGALVIIPSAPSADHELVGGLWQLSAAKAQANFEAWRAQQLAAFEAKRKEVLNHIVGIGMTALAGGDQALAAGCSAARRGLLALQKSPSVKAATNQAEFKAAMKAGYDVVKNAAPPALKSALDAVEL